MKQKTKRIASVLLVLCMAITMFCVNVPQAQAASSYKKSVTKTFTLPPFTQYQIWIDVKPSENNVSGVTAKITSKAKKAEDRMALAALGSGNGEKYIDADHKSVKLYASVSGLGGKLCLYLTNGSEKKHKITVKFTGANGTKVRYDHKEDAGEGAG